VQERDAGRVRGSRLATENVRPCDSDIEVLRLDREVRLCAVSWDGMHEKGYFYCGFPLDAAFGTVSISVVTRNVATSTSDP
jgi:hypothetical protein